MEATQLRPATVSVDEAARLLGISRGAAYRAVHRGDLAAFRIGKRILVPVGRLGELLSSESLDDERGSHGARPATGVKS